MKGEKKIENNDEGGRAGENVRAVKKNEGRTAKNKYGGVANSDMNKHQNQHGGNQAAETACIKI